MRKTLIWASRWPQWHTVMTRTGGHESDLPAGCEDNVCETSQNGPLEKVVPNTSVRS